MPAVKIQVFQALGCAPFAGGRFFLQRFQWEHLPFDGFLKVGLGLLPQAFKQGGYDIHSLIFLLQRRSSAGSNKNLAQTKILNRLQLYTDAAQKLAEIRRVYPQVTCQILVGDHVQQVRTALQQGPEFFLGCETL